MLGVIAGAAGVAAAAGLGSYAAMAPQSQLFGATLASGRDPRQIALTYDDGPNPGCTEALLEVLAQQGVKATFFLIGRFVRQQPRLARTIAEAGHAIGNHTQTHPNLLFTGRKRLRAELQACEQALAEALGEHAPLFRPPYGARRPAVLQLARQQRLTPVLWSVTCYDWKPTTADRVEAHALRQIARQTDRGKIVLLHDGGHTALGADRAHTVEATRRLIHRYHDQGFQFVTVPQMISGSFPLDLSS